MTRGPDPRRMASCPTCRRLIVAHAMGPERAPFRLDCTARDRDEFRAMLGREAADAQGFAHAPGFAHDCRPARDAGGQHESRRPGPAGVPRI